MRDQRFENGGSYLMQRPANAYEEKRTLFSHMEPMSGDGRPLYSEKKPPSLTDFDSIWNGDSRGPSLLSARMRRKQQGNGMHQSVSDGVAWSKRARHKDGRAGKYKRQQ
jgi:hypothetical protein